MGKEGEEKGRRERVYSLFKVRCYEDVVIVDVQFCGVTQSASQLASMSKDSERQCVSHMDH